jgi:Na+/melibiose symporter-like transporter
MPRWFVIGVIGPMVILFFAWTLKAFQVETVDPYSYLNVKAVQKLLENELREFKRALSICRYERWRKVVMVVASFWAIVLMVGGYLLAYVVLVILHKEAILTEGLLSWIPTIVGAVVAGVLARTADLQRRIRK